MQETSRRDREKLNRRNEILIAARKVFATKEYDSATVDEIAEMAEISKGTIYLYFPSKAELFLSTFESGIEGFIKLTQKVIYENKDDLIRGIRELIRTQLIYCQENVDILKMLSSERAHFEFHSKTKEKSKFKKRIISMMAQNIGEVADYIQTGINMGIFRQVDSKDAALALFSIIHGISANWSLEYDDSDLSEKADTIITIFVDGLKKNS